MQTSGIKRIIVKYKIKENTLEDFKKEISRFVEKIQSNELDITEYNIFQEPDNISFVHYISFKTPEAIKKHNTSEHTKRFTQVLQKNAEQLQYIKLNDNGKTQSLIPNQEDEEKKENEEANIHEN